MEYRFIRLWYKKKLKMFLLFARQKLVLRVHFYYGESKPDKTGKLSDPVIIPQIYT